MIQLKNLPINCGVPLLVAKIPSINDGAHSLRINPIRPNLFSRSPGPDAKSQG